MSPADPCRIPNPFPAWSRAAAPALLAVLVLAAGGCGGKDDKQAPPARTLVPATAATADSTDLAAAGPESLMAATAVDTPAAEAVAPPPAKATATRPNPPRATDMARQATPSGTFSLQLGSYRSLDNARAQAARIEALGYAPVLESAVVGGQTHHRVLLRGLADRAEAARVGERLRAELGITYLIRQSD